MKKSFLFLSAIGLTLLGTAAATAQFRTNYGCGQARVVHHAPVYHAPTYKEHAPYVLPVAVTPDYYFSTNSYYRDSLLADAIVGRLLQAQGQQPPQQIPVPQRAPVSPLQPQAAPKPTPQPVPQQAPAQPPQAQAAPAFDPQRFGQIVQQSCLNCHGGQAKRGGFDLSNWATMSAAERYFVLDKVGSQEMPPPEDVAKGKAHPVSDQDFAQFRAWAKAGGRPGQ